MTQQAQADLAYIRRLMEETRRGACLSGGYFIVWGVVMGVALFATWLQLTGAWEYRPLMTWTPCFIAGAVGSVLLARREISEPVQSPGGKLIGTVWLSLGITQLILFFAGLGTNALPGEQMPALFSALVGSGVFLTGVLAGLCWLRNLAFGWWAGAVIMFIWPGMHTLLLMGLMLFALYVLPGLVLIRMKSRQQAAVAEV